jgi:hypothetical protein
MNEDGFLTLTHATERDVDLLLIEKLKCSLDFVKWMVGRVTDNVVERRGIRHKRLKLVLSIIVDTDRRSVQD